MLIFPYYVKAGKPIRLNIERWYVGLASAYISKNLSLSMAADSCVQRKAASQSYVAMKVGTKSQVDLPPVSALMYVGELFNIWKFVLKYLNQGLTFPLKRIFYLLPRYFLCTMIDDLWWSVMCRVRICVSSVNWSSQWQSDLTWIYLDQCH